MSDRVSALAMVAGDAGSGRSDSARKVVWAFDIPPSQRPLPAGMNAASRLRDDQIEALYGTRYRDGWVAMFERHGWDAPPGHAAGASAKTVLERVYFLVGGDVRGVDDLLRVLRDMDCGQTLAHVPRTPYLLWHMVDRDVLWRAGVVPISPAQVPQKRLLVAGEANLPL